MEIHVGIAASNRDMALGEDIFKDEDINPKSRMVCKKIVQIFLLILHDRKDTDVHYCIASILVARFDQAV